MKKKVWRGILVFALCVCIAVTGVLLYEKQQRLRDRSEMLEELERNIGQYDEQSIVLHETSRQKAQELAQMYGAQLRITADGRFATLTLPEGTTIRDIYAMDESLQYIDEMAADYQVKVSELTEEEGQEEQERLPQRPKYTVTDADYELQTYLDYLNMGVVWDLYTGSGITVAIIDTGIDTDHPEFAGRISEYSYNATEDKIVKDYQLPDGSYDWSLVEDEQGHGTAVAGVLGASMNTGNVVGVAPDVNLLVIKAECDEYGTFARVSDLIFGLFYAVERDVQVVNMSFGILAPENPFEEAVRLSYDSDIICVAAAGNDATAALTWPAADEHVIGVGALDGWQMAVYSNYGDNVDIMAPGSTYTTVMGGGYGIKNGTSLAAPLVAGAVALHMNHNIWTTFDEVAEILYASCYDLDVPGRDWYYGFGALDISAFVQEERGTITYDMLTDEVDDLDGVFIRNHTLQQLPEPERLYAIFDGWYYDATCTQEVDYYHDVFTGDLTLYAKWVNEDDGVPYTYTVLDNGTVQITGYTGHRRYITIPRLIDGMEVSAIGPNAFAGQTRLREVNLPDGLTEIGENAFSGCSNLLRIQIPESVTVIGACAFQNNVRLTQIVFEGSSKLTTIGRFAFSGCGSVSTIELPAALTYVDGSAFTSATALHTIQVRQGNTAFCSEDGVLFSASKDTLVAFPAAKSGNYAIPGGTVRLGDYAFASSRLSSVTLEGIMSLGEAVFCNNLRLTEVDLGSTLTEISPSAFFGCAALERITIAKQIVTLGPGAFSFCGLQQVMFEENSSLQTIGNSAFYQCAISEMDIPASVISIGVSAFSGDRLGNPLVRVGFAADSKLQSIGKEAFKGCWLLKNIALPAGLSQMDDHAFMNTGLETVEIPGGLQTLGRGVFANCGALRSITVADGNRAFDAIDGVLYSGDHTTLITYPAGREATEYVLKDTTRVVGYWAFSGAAKLQNVFLPEGLTQISEYAFADCSALGSIYIPDNVLQIGRFAFAGATALSNVMFTENAQLPRIGYGAFAYSGLGSFTVPASVSTIAQGAFEGCENLIDVTFAANSSLESISAYMFDGCTMLQYITFLPGSALKSIQAHGLEGLPNLYSIDFGDAQLTNVDNFAFRFCTQLSELNLPETVTNIGRYAFYQCKNLSELTLPVGLEHIGSYAFLGTNDLNLYMQAEQMPASLDENWDQSLRGYYSGVSSIQQSGDYEFARMSSGDIAILKYLGSEAKVDLTKADLGGDITIIGGSAFEGTQVTAVVLPHTLTTIQAEAFRASALESVTIPATVTFIGREAFAHTPVTQVTFATGSQLKVMEQYAFEGTKNLTAVTLPAALTTMGTGAFQESGLTEVAFADGIVLTEISRNAFTGTKLTAITLPDSVTLVDEHAFSNIPTLTKVQFGLGENIRLMSNAFYHTGLETLRIPANVTYIGEYCFVGLEKLTAFEVDAGNPNYTAVDGLLMSKDQRKLIAVPAGRTGSLTVPQTVEVIGFGAFEQSKLTQVQFPEDANILTIGYRAFFGSAIREITVPASVVSIDYYAFAYCEALESVTFAGGDQLKGIYEGAFLGCINLEHIELPDSIVEISDFAFYGCSKLDRVPVSSTAVVLGIYDYAFAYTGINGDFTTPDTLIDIGDYAFLGTHITTLTIPERNQQELVIGIGAFEDCDHLTAVTLPFVGASFEDTEYTWFGYIFGAGSYEANNLFLPEDLKTVTVTEGITALYEGAFYDVDAPDSLNLPLSLTQIHNRCFNDAGVLFELKSPVELIEWQDGCLIYTSWFDYSNICGVVTLAEGVEKIAGFTFDNCRLLRSVVIPETVTTIERAAFQSTGIINITLPAGITIIEDGAFSGSDNLKKIINHSALDIRPGEEGNGSIALYATTVIDRNGNVIRRDDGEETLETEDGFLYEIRDGEYVLVGYMGTESTVTLPTQINGEKYTIAAFKGAPTVIVPGELGYINRDAFSDGSNVKHVIVSEGITYIEAGAFWYASNLESVTLPKSLTTIESFAFYGCWKLEKLNLPKSVSYIAPDAFVGCGALDMTVEKGNACYFEEGGVLYNSDKSEIIYVSPTLTSITIPNTVVSFNLMNMYSLETIIFEENSALTYLPNNAFLNCTALKTLVLPDSIEVLGASLLQDCGNLKQINIPASLKTLEGNPFYRSSITDVIVPDGFDAFAIVDGVIYDREMTTVLAALAGVTDIIIPATVTTIGQGAFSEHMSLIQVDFEPGSQLTEIPSHAFSCPNLQTITLPENLQRIDQWAFNNIQTIYNRSDLELTFGSEEHGGVAQNAVRIVEKDGTERYNLPGNAMVTDDGFVFVYEEGQLRLIRYIGTEDTVTLPLTYNGEPYVLWQMQGVRNVIIPEGFTEVHNLGFLRCSTLESVVIPDTVTIISGGAFQECRALKSVVLSDSVEFISGSAFSYCTSLASITIPDQVIMGEYAFENTAYINDPANWENGACYLNKTLLAIDPTLTSFTVRPGTTGAMGSAFYDARLLEYLDLGTLNNADLQDCMNLKTLVLRAPLGEDYRLQYMFPYIDGVPQTLQNIILSEEAINSSYALEGITGRNIFVTATEDDTRWDDNFPGWSEGNRVSYAGSWIYVRFYDRLGELVDFAPVRTAQVIRRPVLEEKGFALLGWDTNGDGAADTVPATSATDIHAYAVVEQLHQHNHTASVTAPTCLAQGYTTYSCACGDSYVDDWVKALGHSYGSWQQTTAPTCNEEGQERRDCSGCDAFETGIVQPAGHRSVIDAAVASTCVQPGKTEGAHCDSCGEILIAQQEILPTGIHTYGNWQQTTAPTCTDEGEEIRYCGCGASERREVAATDVHTYGQWEVTKNATPETEGEETRVCTHCGKTETRPIPKQETPEPDVSSPEPDASSPEPDKSFPLWIVLIPVAGIAGVAVFLVLKKRKSA